MREQLHQETCKKTDELISGIKFNLDPQFRIQTGYKVLRYVKPYLFEADFLMTLTNQEENDNTTWSNFSVLRHVLQALCHFPLFTLFLSSMGKILQFTSQVQDTLKRIANHDLTLIKPFMDLGFDTLTKQVDLGGGWMAGITLFEKTS